MAQVPQPPQPPRVPNVAPPRLPRPPGAPPEVRKLGGLFKRRRKDDFLEDSAEDSQAPAADGSSEAPSGEAATAEPPPPPSVPYETWAWPSVEPAQQKGKPPVILILALLLLVLAGAGFGVYKLVHKDKTSPAAAKAATTSGKKQSGSVGTRERAFATGVESILAQSVAQRAKLVQALAATENGCSIPIAQAKQQVASVAAGRQKLLGRAKSLAAPTQQATAIKGLLTKALATSLAANQHYAAWVGGLAGASPCPGSTATNGDYKAAVGSSGQASAAKRAFTSAFNPLAKRLGQKTWSPDSI
jgi:hypothetical protein